MKPVELTITPVNKSKLEKFVDIKHGFNAFNECSFLGFKVLNTVLVDIKATQEEHETIKAMICAIRDQKIDGIDSCKYELLMAMCYGFSKLGLNYQYYTAYREIIRLLNGVIENFNS